MTRAITLRPSTSAALLLSSAVGVLAFLWPFLISPDSELASHTSFVPWLFALVMTLVLAITFSEFIHARIDAKAIALLGILAAIITALRPLGAGLAGIEPIWVILILGGRALGPAFGFVLGTVSLAASAIITGGVGPWLPFQMIAAGWVGLGAGLLPRATGRREILMLVGYAVGACMAYGFVMNLWFWPFTTSLPPQLAFDPGAGVMANVEHWWRFTITTSLGFDIPRAVLAAVLILLAGRPILDALRRAARRARFQPQATVSAS
jgi:energy-coupling factor transport system substrate-specific component